MTRNAGILDSTLRMAIGVGLVVLALNPNFLAPWWGLVGLALAVSGAYGFCPLYRLFGLTTISRV